VRAKRGDLVQPPAVRMNTGRIVLVGSVLFFVAFLVLLLCWSKLRSAHHEIWLWTCLAGWLLGILGWLVIVKHRREGRTL
jgi:hypothetical protein